MLEKVDYPQFAPAKTLCYLLQHRQVSVERSTYRLECEDLRTSVCPRLVPVVERKCHEYPNYDEHEIAQEASNAIAVEMPKLVRNRLCCGRMF
jgi:hypothetical protein